MTDELDTMLAAALCRIQAEMAAHPETPNTPAHWWIVRRAARTAQARFRRRPSLAA